MITPSLYYTHFAFRLTLVAVASLFLSGFTSAALLEDNFDDDTLDPALWMADLNIPQGGASVTEQNQQMELVARGHLVTVEQFDPVVLGGIRITGRWTFVSGDDFMQILTRTDGLPAGDYGETANGIEFFVALTDAVKTVQIRSRDGASIGVVQDVAGVITAGGGMAFDFEILDNGSGGLSFTMTESGNPDNTATTTATVTSDSFALNHIAFHNRESGARTAYLDNLAICTIQDNDGDGLPDDWEIEHGFDPDDNGENPNNHGVAGDPEQGAAGDPDSDGSSNDEEFARGTDPRDEDSDDDELLDGVETGSSVWNSVTDTGTNPLDVDSDNDTLPDGVENPDLAYDPANPLVQPGTNPNLPDTDGDNYRDQIEIEEGTDPTDPQSFPVSAGGGLPLVDDFEDDALNPLLWTVNNTIPQGGASVLEQNGRAELLARGHLVTAQEFDPVRIGGIKITGQWTFVTGDDFLQILTRTDGLPAGQYGETANGIEFNVALTDADKDLQIISRNPATIEIAQDVAGIITAAAGMTFDFEIIDDGAGGLSFTMTEVGNPDNTATTTATVVSDNFNLNYVAFHNRESGRTAYLENVSIASLITEPIRLTDISYDRATNSVTLTWTSSENRSYSVYTSEDLTSLGLEVDDGVPADPGTSTTYTFDSSFPAPPATRRLFFRVRENEAP